MISCAELTRSVNWKSKTVSSHNELMNPETGYERKPEDRP